MSIYCALFRDTTNLEEMVFLQLFRRNDACFRSPCDFFPSHWSHVTNGRMSDLGKVNEKLPKNEMFYINKFVLLRVRITSENWIDLSASLQVCALIFFWVLQFNHLKSYHSASVAFFPHRNNILISPLQENPVCDAFYFLNLQIDIFAVILHLRSVTFFRRDELNGYRSCL